MKPDITYDFNSVEIEGITIEKPKRVSAMQWLDFWDQAVNMDTIINDFEKAEENNNIDWQNQISRLEDEIDDLNDEICELEKEIERYKSILGEK